MKSSPRWIITIAAFTIFGSRLFSQEAERRSKDQGPAAPEFVCEFKHELLKSPTCVSTTRDGKFLYTSGYNAPSCLVLRHNTETDELEFVSAVTDEDRLDGTTSIRLSNDEKFAVAASFRSGGATLMSRDAETGELTMLDTKTRDDEGISGFGFPVEASFSHDDRFVNVLDDTGGVTVFRVTKPFRGGNEVRVNQNKLVACATGSGTIAIFDRNSASGKVTLRQMVVDRDRYGWVSGLAISPDGNYVYAACEKPSTICVLRLLK